ncbi:chemotaxis protein CheW [Coralloluteibacterium stylophorae]|uniref:Chemotaxis protein CheW n=1 Tax=Coralloluteibacterium stylophorae TaxID=1776034 RepID=A0A8J8AXJ6_9GAMM|nr:chemotaxis protein CheW [Coralloluteibacterium stylophorae]MBS7457249.1 chemotaxis protein CheW [Coralloluteibacterium stylophorae]
MTPTTSPVDPMLDDYMDLLLGPDPAVPEATNDAAPPAEGLQSALADAIALGEGDETRAPVPAPPVAGDAEREAALDAVLDAAGADDAPPAPGDSDDLEAAFEAALNLPQADAPPAPPAPGDSDDLEAAFEAALNLPQADAPPAPPAPGDSDDLEAAFEAALNLPQADAPPAPPAPGDSDDLEAAFEAALNLPQAGKPPAPQAPGDSDDLEAAFEAALNLPKVRAVPAPTPLRAAASTPLTRAEHGSKAPVSAQGSRWLYLRIAGQAHALELLKVQEVLRIPAIQPLRGASTGMLGVMNLRGQIVPVLDLGALLYGQSCVPDEASRVVVLEERGETLGLLVQGVTDVATLTAAMVEPHAIVGTSRAAGAFLGIARVQCGPVVLLDAGHLLAA